MKTVRLIHWDDDEGLERQRQLEALGFDALFAEGGDGVHQLRHIRSNPPDAVVIDLSKRPSHGREVAFALRSAKATRFIPLIFAGGEPEKVQKTRQLIPDAVYATWGRMKTALPKAVTNPPKNPVLPNHNVAWSKPTVAKLGVKAGFKVALLASPEGFAETLKPLPPKVAFTARPESSADLFMCFSRSTRELQAHLLALQAADRQTAWLIWPKTASGVKTDLDGNVVRNAGLAAGWVDFKICSVDDTWSALAFKRRR
jgi:CheY-like chemotaxis protein